MKLKKSFLTFIAIATMLTGSTVCNAQKLVSGSVENLKKNGVVLVEIDYSKAVIMGMGEKAFADYENEWTKDQSDVTFAFINGVNNKTGNLLAAGHSIDCDLTMKIQVIAINEHGDWRCKAIVTNKQNKTKPFARLTKSSLKDATSVQKCTISRLAQKRLAKNSVNSSTKASKN